MNTHASLFHSLEGSNICFKPVSKNDLREMHGYVSDKDVSRFIGWRLMNTLGDTREHIKSLLKWEAEGTHLYASIVLKATQAVIGNAMVFNFDTKANHAEIGYVLDKADWGRGYGTECVALMTDFAFDALYLHKLRASVVDANAASARILEKNGYVLEGRLKDHFFIEGRYYDALFFGKICAQIQAAQE